MKKKLVLALATISGLCSDMCAMWKFSPRGDSSEKWELSNGDSSSEGSPRKSNSPFKRSPFKRRSRIRTDSASALEQTLEAGDEAQTAEPVLSELDKIEMTLEVNRDCAVREGQGGCPIEGDHRPFIKKDEQFYRHFYSPKKFEYILPDPRTNERYFKPFNILYPAVIMPIARRAVIDAERERQEKLARDAAQKSRGKGSKGKKRQQRSREEDAKPTGEELQKMNDRITRETVSEVMSLQSLAKFDPVWDPGKVETRVVAPFLGMRDELRKNGQITW